MRVVFSSHSDALGGAERCLVELVTGLVQRRVEVHVLLPRQGPLSDRLLEAGASVHYVRNTWWVSHVPISLPYRIRMGLGILVSIIQSVRVLHRVRPDIAVTNTQVAPALCMAARLVRVRHVAMVQEFVNLDHSLVPMLSLERQLKTLYRLSNAVIVASQALLDMVAEYGIGSAHLVYYAVESTEQVHYRCNLVRPAVVLVGQKKPSKGQGDAIEAIARLRAQGFDVNLYLVGDSDGKYDQCLMDSAACVNVRDLVHNVPATENAAGFMLGSDAVLMCSTYEALGRVTVEAMKLGIPVVGAASGGTVELLSAGRGLMYPPGDIAFLADSIRKCIEDSEATSRRVFAARIWACESFSESGYVDGVLKVLQSC